jgi:hypothetical protein
MDQGEYGVGSGRTQDQETGGIGGGSSNYDDDNSGGGKKDSTMGKLMEKAGGVLKHDGLQQKGAQKRADAGGYDDSTGGSGGGYGDNSSGGGYGDSTSGGGGYDDNSGSGNTGRGGNDNY